jgi:hypothetical protein
MCGLSLQIAGEWWPWLISGVVQKVMGVGEIADAKGRGCELWLRSVFSCASPVFVHALLNVAARFFLKFLSNLVLSLNDRFDKRKEYK